MDVQDVRIDDDGLRIRALDGFELAATPYQEGLAVLTCDYRGIGGSRPRSLKGRALDWIAAIRASCWWWGTASAARSWGWRPATSGSPGWWAYPHEVGAAEIGHFGFFRETLWREAAGS